MLVELPPALAAAEALVAPSRALGSLADRIRPIVLKKSVVAGSVREFGVAFGEAVAASVP